MKRLFLLFLIITKLCSIPVFAQEEKDGKWIIIDEIITSSWNEDLYENANVRAFVCDESGEAKFGEGKTHGRFLMIKNNSEWPIYYRASPKGLGSYTSRKSSFFISTVSNMTQYYLVLPKQQELVEIGGYEDAISRNKEMRLVVEFKYFLSNKRQNTLKPKEDSSLTSYKPILSRRNTTKPNDLKTSPKNKSFFVFFIASVSQGRNSIHIVSKPIFHTGQLTDLLIKEKTDFVQTLKAQFPNISTDNIDYLVKNDYEKVSIQYAKPYSTQLLFTREDCSHAIDDYVIDFKKAFEGLTYSHEEVFISLK